VQPSSSHPIGGTAPTWHTTSEALRDACESLFTIGHAFFAQPKAEKERHCPAPGSMTGWRNIGIEYSQHPSRPDQNETFCFRSRDDMHTHDTSAHELPADLTPREQSGNQRLIDACRTVQEGLDAMAAVMLTEIAERCGVSATAQPIPTARESWLQLNNSRPDTAPGEFIQEDHEDGHLLTILMADAPGLEVMLADGTWSAVLPTPSNVIAFAGECGALLTNDGVTPTRHRVRAERSVSRRMSVAYFVNPDTDQVLAPWILGERNRDVDLVHWGRNNPARFGLPVL
jgi:isopenicillin N synthase-like dioxygenase